MSHREQRILSQQSTLPANRPGIRFGVMALAVSQLLGPVVQVVQLAVLAAILDPGDFGLWVTPTVIYSACAIVCEVAVPAAIVAQRSSGRGVVALWGPALIGLTVILGLAQSSDRDRLLVLSLVVPVALLCVAMPSRARLSAGQRFGYMGSVELSAAVVSCAVAVTAAFLGAGVWSFAVATVVRQGFLTVLQYFGARQYRGEQFDRDRTSTLAIVLFYEVMFLAGNIDYIYGSRALSAHEVGLYFVAFNVATVAVLKFATIANRVTLPLVVVGKPDSWNRRVEVSLAIASSVSACLSTMGWWAVQLLGPLVGSQAWRQAVDPTSWLLVGSGALGLATIASTLVLSGGARWRLTTIACLDVVGMTLLLAYRRPGTASDLAALVSAWFGVRACFWLAAGFTRSNAVPIRLRLVAAAVVLTSGTFLALATLGHGDWWAGLALAFAASSVAWVGWRVARSSGVQ